MSVIVCGRMVLVWMDGVNREGHDAQRGSSNRGVSYSQNVDSG